MAQPISERMAIAIPRRASQGSFLGIRDEGIVGWAWDPERPHVPVEVEMLLGGQPVGTMRADLFDRELAARGIGNGSHAFRFKLDRIPDLPCELSAHIVGTDVRFGTQRIETNKELANALEPQARYEGAVDDFMRTNGRIHGWVYDRLNPVDRVRVTLRDWNEPLLAVKADIHRSGLEEQGKSDGNCAFALRLPVSVLDGRPHTLRVTVEDTDFELPGSPIEYDPTMARELIETIAMWRSDVMRIDSALTRINRLVDRLASQRKQPTLAVEISSSAVADEIKTRLKRIYELVTARWSRP